MIALLLSFAMLVCAFGVDASALGVSARSAVLMCANNGEVLYSKNSGERMPMASTTKIMTSLLAIEAAVPDMEIKVTHDMVAVEGTSMGLREGDSVSMRELVYGMLLQSGNDAANTVAVVLGGSNEGFARMMNERAREIGMNDTNFVTASGLDSGEHYSTAYDMALLACESISNPEFAAVCSSKTARLTTAIRRMSARCEITTDCSGATTALLVSRPASPKKAAAALSAPPRGTAWCLSP